MYLKRPQSETETTIFARISYNKQTLKYYLPEKINPKFWNSTEHRARQTQKFPTHPEFNRGLENKTASIHNVYMKYFNDNKEAPTIEIFKTLLDIEFGKVEKITYTFFSYFEKYIANLSNKVNSKTGKLISKGTKGTYQNTLNILREFGKTYKRKIGFETIDIDFYYDFKEYLNNERNLSVNTIGKLIKNIKVVLNDATENGHNKNLAFKGKRFIVESEKSTSIYLNEIELAELYSLDLNNSKKLDTVRDLFLIGCHTGLRYSDYSNIKPENVDIENNMLNIQTQKTGISIAIPLHTIVKNILRKYDYILPKSISNQKTNDYLKDIGLQVPSLHEQITKTITRGGIQEVQRLFKYEILTTHTARRSFATNLYISGFPSISIMKITGHTSERSFMKYIKITPTDNAKLLQEHWNKNGAHLKVV